MARKVLVFHPEGNIHQNPTLWEVLNSFIKKDVAVTLLSGGKSLHPVPNGVRVLHRPKIINSLLKNILLLPLGDPVRRLMFFFLHAFGQADSYDICIGVDREGLLEAELFTRRFGGALVHFSFELMFEEETSQGFKRPEVKAASKAIWFLAQDHERAKHLSVENRIPLSRIRAVPVAPKGEGLPLEPRVRDAVGIPREKKVALFMGSLLNWSGFEAVCLGLHLWPEDWVLLVNSRDARNTTRAEFKLNESRIYHTTAPMGTFSDLGHLLNGVDVGLAFYIPTYTSRYVGRNIASIGLSSGKTSIYCSFGLPVILNFSGEYARLIRAYDAGWVIDSVEKLPALLKHINPSEKEYGALSLFRERLDYALFEEQIIAGILGTAKFAGSRSQPSDL